MRRKTVKKNIYPNKIKTQTQKKPRFLFNPNDPKRSFDVYINKNPKDTIPIKYKTVDDVENTIRRLEKLYKAKNIRTREFGKLE